MAGPQGERNVGGRVGGTLSVVLEQPVEFVGWREMGVSVPATVSNQRPSRSRGPAIAGLVPPMALKLGFRMMLRWLKTRDAHGTAWVDDVEVCRKWAHLDRSLDTILQRTACRGCTLGPPTTLGEGSRAIANLAQPTSRGSPCRHSSVHPFPEAAGTVSTQEALAVC